MSAVECQICLNSMVGRNPRALPCLHTFCEPCLSNLVSQAVPPARLCPVCGYAGTIGTNGVCYHCATQFSFPSAPPNKQMIRCPSCRVQATLPVGGVKAFPLNFMINQLTELHVDSSQRCQLCKDGTPLFGCETCLKALCKKCRERHDSVPALSGHFVRALNLDGVAKCPNHHGEAVYVCTACAERICIECVLSDQHQQHKDKVVDSKTWMDSEGEKVVNLQTNIRPKLKAVQADLQAMKLNSENIEKTMSAVNDTANQIKQKIDKERNIMVNKLKQEGQLVGNAIKKMEQISSEAAKFCSIKEEDLKSQTIVRDMINAIRKGERVQQSTTQLPILSKTWFTFVPEDFVTFGTLKTSSSVMQ